MKLMKDGRGLMAVSPHTAAIVNGQEDLSTWSDEELERGQRRAKNGRWMGNKPTVVAKGIHDELVRRKLSKAYDLLKESTYDAVKVLVEIAKDKRADKAVRVRAAELLLDRTLGKAPQHVALSVEPAAWKSMITQAIVGTEEQILEGEVVEDEH